MNISLPPKLKQLFSRNREAVMAGFSLHPKFVRLVIGVLNGGVWHYREHVEVAVDSDEQWAPTLEDLIKTHKLKTAECTISLPFNRYQLLQIDKPPMPDEELPGALPFAVKDFVTTIAQDDLIADFFHVAAKVPMQGDKVNVVVTSRKAIMPLIDVFIKNKVELLGIVPEEMLIQNVLGHGDAAVLLLSQQLNEEVALQIVKQNKLYFARKLRGFNRLHDYSPEELAEGLNDSLSLEIQRSMDYFETQLKQAKVKDILLALPSDHQNVIAQGILANFDRTRVEVMGIRNPKIDAPEDLSEQFYPALGGAVEYIDGTGEVADGT